MKNTQRHYHQVAQNQIENKISHGDTNLKNVHYSLHTRKNLEDKNEGTRGQKKLEEHIYIPLTLCAYIQWF